MELVMYYRLFSADTFSSTVSTSSLRSNLLPLITLATFLVPTPLLAVDEIVALGSLPQLPISRASGVSADGSTVVGRSSSSVGYDWEAFRWTEADGMVGLGFLPGGSVNSDASGVNADGSVVVGASRGSNGIVEAFRWTETEGMVGLGYLPGRGWSSRANGVNADGSVVVGESSGNNGTEAFRWTEADGMVGLGDLPGGGVATSSRAYDVSADGSVVVGVGNGDEAFRWTQADGMVGLGFLPAGGYRTSIAVGVNADGSVVVGTSHEPGISVQAFRWTQADGMVGLGFLPGGNWSWANDVNANGSVVVGRSDQIGGSSEAFRWTQVGGMQSVSDWLAESDVEVDGWYLRSATGVNADGSVVVGDGFSPEGKIEAWLARNESGLISLDTFAGSLGSVGGTSSLGTQLAGLVLGGSHHQPLLAQPFLDGDNCAWINGDLGRYHRDRDADLTLGEMGACHDFIPSQLRAGLGVGASRATEDLDFSGDTELDGQYLVAELDYQIPDSNLIASLTALAGEWDATIDRGYLNAGSPDRSRGKTDVDVTAVRARLDWIDAYQQGDVSISPRIEFSHFRTRADSYTERGGGFPAHYDSRSDTVRELRIGGSAEMGLSESSYLRGMLEGVHRFDDDGPRLSGEVIGLFGFSFPGEDFRQNWARAGIEVGSKVSSNAVISASINASTRGEDPDYSAGLSLKATF